LYSRKPLSHPDGEKQAFHCTLKFTNITSLYCHNSTPAEAETVTTTATTVENISRNIWHTAAAISGATAVGLGAYGAHKFKPSDPKWIDVYQRGSDYHLFHSLLLAGAPMTRRPNIVSISY
jgi:hypothetical protein